MTDREYLPEEPEQQFRGIWIPAGITALVADGTISIVEAWLLAIIDSYVRLKGEGCWVSLKTLAAKMGGYKLKWISSVRSKLRDLGLIIQVGWKRVQGQEMPVYETLWSRIGEERGVPRKNGGGVPRKNGGESPGKTNLSNIEEEKREEGGSAASRPPALPRFNSSFGGNSSNGSSNGKASPAKQKGTAGLGLKSKPKGKQQDAACCEWSDQLAVIVDQGLDEKPPANYKRLWPGAFTKVLDRFKGNRHRISKALTGLIELLPEVKSGEADVPLPRHPIQFGNMLKMIEDRLERHEHPPGSGDWKIETDTVWEDDGNGGQQTKTIRRKVWVPRD